MPAGRRGADLVQEVRDEGLASCGRIIWEVKNTKHWSPAWVQKLKDDQRACGASIAVIVSVARPEAMGSIAQVDGVWVASVARLRLWLRPCASS